MLMFLIVVEDDFLFCDGFGVVDLLLFLFVDIVVVFKDDFVY